MLDWNTSLGSKVKDTVTGFEGVTTGRLEYLNGCQQWCVKPPVDKDGKILDGEWIDSGQLEIVGIGIADKIGATAEPEQRPGGPGQDEPRGF